MAFCNGPKPNPHVQRIVRFTQLCGRPSVPDCQGHSGSPSVTDLADCDFGEARHWLVSTIHGLVGGCRAPVMMAV